MAWLTAWFFTFNRSWNLSTSYHRTPCHTCSAYLGVGLIKNKGGVGLFQISQKERLFHVLYQPSDNLAIWSLLAPFQKSTFFPLQFGQEENISGNSIESRVYWFILKIARVFPVPTGTVGIGWWKLIIVNITPISR